MANVQKYESKQHPGTFMVVDLDSYNPKTKTYFADMEGGKSISINGITISRWWTAVNDTEDVVESTEAEVTAETPIIEEQNIEEQTVENVEDTEVPKKSSKKKNTSKKVEPTSETSTTRSKKVYNFTIDSMQDMLNNVFGADRVNRIKGHCGCTVKSDSGNVMYEFYVRKFDGTVRFYTRKKYYDLLNISDVNWVVNDKFNLAYQFTVNYTDVTENFIKKFNLSV